MQSAAKFLAAAYGYTLQAVGITGNAIKAHPYIAVVVAFIVGVIL